MQLYTHADNGVATPGLTRAYALVTEGLALVTEDKALANLQEIVKLQLQSYHSYSIMIDDLNLPMTDPEWSSLYCYPAIPLAC